MPNFHRAAYSYLEDWVLNDRCFHAKLAFESGTPLTEEEASARLAKAATYYGVARTLRRIDEEPRLVGAYRLLCQTIPPKSAEEAETQVAELAVSLKNKYGKALWSAASKFLWLRFRSPIVIYDSVVVGYLSRECGYKNILYADYCNLWRREFQKHEASIRSACAELSAIKRFTVARQLEDQQIDDWATSRWFLERVFDYAMLNDVTDRKAGPSSSPL